MMEKLLKNDSFIAIERYFRSLAISAQSAFRQMEKSIFAIYIIIYCISSVIFIYMLLAAFVQQMR
jgi:hypothetical protein